VMNSSVKAQLSYDNCSQALELCPNRTFSINNLNANMTLCPGCEDDFNNCFVVNNSIWLEFTTNAAGGDVQIDFTNLVFEANAGQGQELQATLIETAVPCNAASFNFIGNCVSNATTNFSINAAGLAANTTYYIVVDGSDVGAGITSPAECSFDLQINGLGVDRPIGNAAITASGNAICLNETVDFNTAITDCPENGEYLWFINDTLQATTTLPNWSTSELINGDIVSVKTTCYLLCVDTISDAAPAF